MEGRRDALRALHRAGLVPEFGQQRLQVGEEQIGEVQGEAVAADHP